MSAPGPAPGLGRRVRVHPPGEPLTLRPGQHPALLRGGLALQLPALTGCHRKRGQPNAAGWTLTVFADRIQVRLRCLRRYESLEPEGPGEGGGDQGTWKGEYGVGFSGGPTTGGRRLPKEPCLKMTDPSLGGGV